VPILRPMRTVLILLPCLFAGACSFTSDLPPPEVGQPPDQVQLKAGIAAGINDSHFAKPVEVTDLFRAPLSSTAPWMVCIRSATSDEARRLTYSAFYGKNALGKDGQFIKSRYSVYADNCATQAYHSFE
jgi:hypothetical protein